MTFYHSWDRLTRRPYPRGYQAPSTALLNTETAVLNIHPSEEPLLLSSPPSLILPDFIEISVRLLPVWISLPLVTASCQRKTQVFPSQALYPSSDPSLQSLEVVLNGSIRIRSNDDKESRLIREGKIGPYQIPFSPDQPIPLFEFDYWPHSILRSLDQESSSLVPIWPVGGFFSPSTPWASEQRFCSVLEENGMSVCRKTTLSQWQDQGFSPPHPAVRGAQTLSFQTQRASPYCSLKHFIQKGGIQFSLSLGEKNLPLQVIDPIQRDYQSVDITPGKGDQGLLHFVKKGSN